MKLIELPALPIAFLRRTGPYGPENRALVERLKRLARDADPSRPMLEAYPLSLVQRGRCRFYVPVL